MFDSQNCTYCVVSMVCVNGTAQLQWRHNEPDGVYNYLCLESLLNRLFRRGSMKTSKLHVTVPCEWNPSVTGEFPTQRASDAGNASIWWRHHVILWSVFMPVGAVLYTPRCYMGHQGVIWALKLLSWKFQLSTFFPGCITFLANAPGLMVQQSGDLLFPFLLAWTSCSSMDYNSITVTSYWARCCVSNHRLLDCFVHRVFGRISKKSSKLRVTGYRWIPLTESQ